MKLTASLATAAIALLAGCASRHYDQAYSQAQHHPASYTAPNESPDDIYRPSVDRDNTYRSTSYTTYGTTTTSY